MKNFRIKDLMITVYPGNNGLKDHAAVITGECPGPTKCGKLSTPNCAGPTKCGKTSIPDCMGPTKCGAGSNPDCGGPTKCGKSSKPGPKKPKHRYLDDAGILENIHHSFALLHLKKTLAGMQAKKEMAD